VGKPQGKRPLGRPRRRWEDKLKWIIRNSDGGMDWTDLVQDRDGWQTLVNAEMDLEGP
jgi:hypothetical protein